MKQDRGQQIDSFDSKLEKVRGITILEAREVRMICDLLTESNDSSNRRNNLAIRCASCVGGIGLTLCTIFMTFGAIGVFAAGISQNSSGNMAAMGSVVVAPNASVPTQIFVFFSQPIGQITLIASFSLMILGLWFHSKKILVLVASLLGSGILFVGMYAYFYVPLEVLASVLLILAYAISFIRRSKTAQNLPITEIAERKRKIGS